MAHRVAIESSTRGVVVAFVARCLDCPWRTPPATTAAPWADTANRPAWVVRDRVQRCAEWHIRDLARKAGLNAREPCV